MDLTRDRRFGPVVFALVLVSLVLASTSETRTRAKTTGPKRRSRVRSMDGSFYFLLVGCSTPQTRCTFRENTYLSASRPRQRVQDLTRRSMLRPGTGRPD